LRRERAITDGEVWQPADMRDALGALLADTNGYAASLRTQRVFLAKGPVSTDSGEFLCLVAFGKGNVPLGLVASGRAYLTNPTSVRWEDYSKFGR
jgi:hypothetical protein